MPVGSVPTMALSSSLMSLAREVIGGSVSRCLVPLLAVALTAGAAPAARAATRVVSADVRQVKGPLNTMPRVCVGAGRANEGLRADWQRQLAYVNKECGFTYLRMHGLLGDDMGVYREDKNGRPEYNWQYIDEVYDFLQRIGMKPFVELGFTPGALASGSQTIFWWKGNVTPPKDLKQWGDLIRALVGHFRERYGLRDNDVFLLVLSRQGRTPTSAPSLARAPIN